MQVDYGHGDEEEADTSPLVDAKLPLQHQSKGYRGGDDFEVVEEFKCDRVDEHQRDEDDVVVYKAIHRVSGDKVVIKLINGLGEPDKIPKNVRILSNLKGHTNIIHLREWFRFQDDLCYAIVLDYHQNDNAESVWGKPKQIQCFI